MTGLSEGSIPTSVDSTWSALAYVFALGQNSGPRTQSREPRTENPAAALQYFWATRRAQKLSVWLSHAICTCRMNNGAGGGARGICVDYLSSEPHQDRKEGPRPGFVLSRFHCSQLLLLQRDARCKIRFSFLFLVFFVVVGFARFFLGYNQALANICPERFINFNILIWLKQMNT